jgi:putative nucleotidyltransferase with HDIG domain
MDNGTGRGADQQQKILEISSAMDKYEGYSHPHGVRVAAIADALAEKLGLAEQDRVVLRQAAFVHDIGEMAMNREFIRAQRELDPEERVDMQRHPVIGEQEAAKVGFKRGVQLVIRWHHEWWNGSGYPDAIEREQIPIAARILRLVDTYCAMTDDRPYKKAVSVRTARDHIRRWAGVEFDPKVAKAFLELTDLPELASYKPENPARKAGADTFPDGSADVAGTGGAAE